jgi:hypothetical protein
MSIGLRDQGETDALDIFTLARDRGAISAVSIYATCLVLCS